MAPNALIGSRIRERRSQLRLRQSDLARRAGVSAAYLNLIEHNRRRVTPDVLTRIAQGLGVSPAHLEGEGAADLVAELDPMVANTSSQQLERVEDFASRFPGWAKRMVQQGRRIAQLERALTQLDDTHGQNSALSQGLHELLTSASSLRSTASILTETPDLEPVWRQRFERNLTEDSARLTHAAAQIAGTLHGVALSDVPAAAPQDEVEAWLADHGWHLPDLEAGGPPDPLAEQAGLSPAGQELLLQWLRVYAQDCRALPLPAFQTALGQLGLDPARLAHHFRCAPDRIFRRLACLPPSEAALGLIIADGSGSLILRKSLAGFALPRFGAACPLWPLFAALARPGQSIEVRLDVAGPHPLQLEAMAWASLTYPQGFSQPPILRGYMLLHQGRAKGHPLWRIGSSCRLCARRDCAARREPALVALEGPP